MKSKDKVFFEMDESERLEMIKEYRNQIHDKYSKLEIKDSNKNDAIKMIVEYLLSMTSSFEIIVLEKVVDLLNRLDIEE